MPHTPCLLCGQPQEIRDQIAKMAQKQHYAVIVEWLNGQGIMATWNQVRYFINTHNYVTRLQEIPPQKTYKDKVRVYIGLLLDYDDPTFTINNLRMRGASWSGVTNRLRDEGLIEPMRKYSPIRWRILASKEGLHAWLKKEEEKK